VADDDLDKALRSDHGSTADPKAEEAKQSIRHGDELKKLLKKAPQPAPAELKCPKCGSKNVINRSAQYQIFVSCKDCQHQWPRGMSLPNEGPEMPEDPREKALSKLQKFRDPRKNFRRGEG